MESAAGRPLLSLAVTAGVIQTFSFFCGGGGGRKVAGSQRASTVGSLLRRCLPPADKIGQTVEQSDGEIRTNSFSPSPVASDCQAGLR